MQSTTKLNGHNNTSLL